MNTWIWILLVIGGGYVAMRLLGHSHGGHGSHGGGGCGNGEDEANDQQEREAVGTEKRPHPTERKQRRGGCC